MTTSLQKKLEGKRGIRFFGDVHGCYDVFVAMTEDAIEQGYHLHSLGDLIDKGPQSPDCMGLACDLYDDGLLDLTPGNHCEKFMRWMQGRPVKLKPSGLGLTVSQLASHPNGKAIAQRYSDLVAESLLWSRFGDLYAVHAAFHPSMAGRDGPRLMGYVGSGEVRSHALYGETGGSFEAEEPRYPKRTYGWVDNVPCGVVVLIGHSICSLKTPTERQGAPGGRAIHLDTGLWKGGKLSYLDVSTEILLGEAPLEIPSFPLV
jgi:protein phosphatase